MYSSYGSVYYLLPSERESNTAKERMLQTELFVAIGISAGYIGEMSFSFLTSFALSQTLAKSSYELHDY